MTDLVFTAHALDQMRARQIPEIAVQHVVDDPEDVLERDHGCTKYSGVWESRSMLVVACGDEEPYRVRTVIERARRRWR